jgi:glucosyl-3-phosphoglycerate synthase
MADFFQDGGMATLHRLGGSALARLETGLVDFSRDHPIALVVPCHARDLASPAVRRMVEVLAAVPYLRQIVIGVDGASEAAWLRARRLFAALPQETLLLWSDGPRLRRLLRQLTLNDLPAGPSGKGRNLWLGFGAVLASGNCRMVAAHDCDILTYDRELLARLCYPVAHPGLGFDFAKGYSARFTDRLNGRVMRLLLTPLLRSLQSIIGSHPFLTFLDSFRYPLSGEVAMDLPLVRRARVPADWGVEIGLLAEVFRLVSPEGICQVDVAECYDHKHQDLSARDPAKGLNKMAADLAACIFRSLAGHGVKLDSGAFDALLTSYTRAAEDTMRFCAADAEINGLSYDRHQEKLAVATFGRSIRRAARTYLADPLANPNIPDWNRVEAVLPDFLPDLREAIRRDAE